MTRTLSLLLTALLLASCAQSDTFTVTAEIENAGVETIILSYFADGHLQQVNGHAPEAGKPVKLTGSSAGYTLAQLKRPDGEVIATFTARNGDRITVRTAAGTLPQISGNGPCDSLTMFVNDNASLVRAGHSPALSKAVERYVTAHPQSVTSTLLLVTLFDASQQPETADSLYSRLAIDVKAPGIVDGWAEQLSLATTDRMSVRVPPLTIYGKGDSAVSFVAISKPYSFIAFTQGTRHDSIDREMRRLQRDHAVKRLQILEITLDADSAAWNSATTRDSATWQRGWNPGGAASPALRRLSVPRTPFFIVTDSTGTQIYRGTSVSAATATVGSRLK